MTRSERGRCVMVPVSLAGLVVMWGVAVLLTVWPSMGGPQPAWRFGLLCSAAAAAWTVVYAMTQQQELTREAFDLGREVGAESKVRPLTGVDR